MTGDCYLFGGDSLLAALSLSVEAKHKERAGEGRIFKAGYNEDRVRCNN